MSAAEQIVPRKIWTRVEVDRLALDGLSLELVDGELIDRMGKRPPHIYWKTVLRDWLALHFGSEHVRFDDPIDVAPADNPTSEPEPDLTVTFQSIRESRGANSTPEDLRLVVEISDRTFVYDTAVKAALYARAGIREYWVIDVRSSEDPKLIVHREPRNGSYFRLETYVSAESATVFDGLSLCLARI